jgi:predicted enzyme related to lactoylglutathione lyase
MASISAFLNVEHLARSMGFYQGLGFRPTYVRQNDRGQDIYGGVELEGAEIEMGWIGGNDDKEYRTWVGTPLGAGVVLYVTVKDVDAIAKRAKELGAIIEYGPETRSYGRVLGLNDPDGYVVTFLEEKAPRKHAKKSAKSAKKPAKKTSKKKSPARR